MTWKLLQMCMSERVFLDQTEEDSDLVSSFHPSSTWMPPKGRDLASETYIKTVKKDINHHIELLWNKTPRDNLSLAERKALKISDIARRL